MCFRGCARFYCHLVVMWLFARYLSVDTTVKILRARAHLMLLITHITINKTNIYVCIFIATPCTITITIVNEYIMLNWFGQLVIPQIIYRMNFTCEIKRTKELRHDCAIYILLKFLMGRRKRLRKAPPIKCLTCAKPF